MRFLQDVHRRRLVGGDGHAVILARSPTDAGGGGIFNFARVDVVLRHGIGRRTDPGVARGPGGRGRHRVTDDGFGDQGVGDCDGVGQGHIARVDQRERVFQHVAHCVKARLRAGIGLVKAEGRSGRDIERRRRVVTVARHAVVGDIGDRRPARRCPCNDGRVADAACIEVCLDQHVSCHECRGFAHLQHTLRRTTVIGRECRTCGQYQRRAVLPLQRVGVHADAGQGDVAGVLHGDLKADGVAHISSRGRDRFQTRDFGLWRQFKCGWRVGPVARDTVVAEIADRRVAGVLRGHQNRVAEPAAVDVVLRQYIRHLVRPDLTDVELCAVARDQGRDRGGRDRLPVAVAQRVGQVDRVQRDVARVGHGDVKGHGIAHAGAGA